MYMDVPLVLVEDDAALASAVARFEQEPALAVDTEADSLHHYQEKVCLIQISIPDADFIIDPLKVTDLSPLGPVMASERHVKVFHGADYDVVSLKRDHGFTIRNLFDTMVAARFLDLPGLGLADLVSSVFRVPLDKKFQRHDWAARPLEPEHLDYARGDTHWLLPLREVLMYRLQKAGWLAAVQEECARLEDREWRSRVLEPDAFLRLKGASGLGEQNLKVLRRLHAYRDDQARRMDRPVFKVIPDRVLVDAARTLPATVDDLQRFIRRGSALMRQHGAALVAEVQAGLADETPLPRPEPAARTARTAASPVAAVVAERLKAWRVGKVEAEGIPAMLVSSNALIREISRVAPTSRQDLLAVPEVRAWQVERYGDEIVDLVKGCTDAHAATRERRRRRRRPRGGRSGASGDGGAERAAR